MSDTDVIALPDAPDQEEVWARDMTRKVVKWVRGESGKMWHTQMEDATWQTLLAEYGPVYLTDPSERADEVRQLVVHPTVWDGIVTYLVTRGIEVGQLGPQTEDDLPTYYMRPAAKEPQ